MLVLAPIVACQARWRKEMGRVGKERAIKIQKAALMQFHASKVRCAQSALSNSRVRSADAP